MTIVVAHISKSYGKQLALNDISFSIGRGEVVGLLGANGAGKSTLMKILTGTLPPDKGEASIGNLPVGIHHTAFRRLIGYLPENNPLYPEMYVREYLGMIAGIYALPGKKARVEAIIEQTGLSPEAGKTIGALSKGYRQRVGLAQALVHDPEVLILDEPTTGLDPNQLEEIRNLIRTLSREKTVILSTHIMQEVEAVCTRVIILNKGEVVADGPSSVLKNAKNLGKQSVLIGFSESILPDELRSLPFVSGTEQLSPGTYRVTAAVTDDIRPRLFQTAVEKGWTLLSMQEEAKSVESVFRELTGKG
ncbi:MAG TPA: ATP-binding cassette domain-containing protein [Prolixibacteraceae bacterium]|nr:ATP-binding cassette domain-containing protein [Prolixibacteraceae bacterium]